MLSVNAFFYAVETVGHHPEPVWIRPVRVVPDSLCYKRLDRYPVHFIVMWNVSHVWPTCLLACWQSECHSPKVWIWKKQFLHKRNSSWSDQTGNGFLLYPVVDYSLQAAEQPHVHHVWQKGRKSKKVILVSFRSCTVQRTYGELSCVHHVLTLDRKGRRIPSARF